MLASSVIIENIPLIPVTPKIVIEIPKNSPDELNYNSKSNINSSLMNDLFIQPNNHDWISGTSSPGSCLQNLLTPYYWPTNQRHLLSTYENSSSHENLKDDDINRTPSPILFTSSSSTSPISSLHNTNQYRNSYCCIINPSKTKYYPSLDKDQTIDFQHSSSTSLISNYNLNKSLYLDTDHYTYQQKQYLQSDRLPYIHGSFKTKSITNPSNRSISPYSFYNYSQCIPYLSMDNHHSDIDFINYHNGNHYSDSVYLSKMMLSKIQKQTIRRTSSPLSYHSLMISSQILCNSSITTTTSSNNNNNKSGYLSNYPCNRPTIRQLSTVQRSNSLPELSTIIKYNEYKINSTIKYYTKKMKKNEKTNDLWYKHKSIGRSCNFQLTPLQSNYMLPCQQKLYLSPSMNHRRHTEGCSHKPNTSLLLLQSSRRSNSVCSQNHCDFNMNNHNITHENIISSMRNVNFIHNNGNDLYVSNQSFLRASNSQLMNNCNHHIQPSISLLVNSSLGNDHNNDPIVNPTDLDLNKTDIVQNRTELHVKKGDSFTHCLCSLIVLLVCMQLFLGTISTALGLFLTWKVPELNPMECAYLSGIPLIISGLVGMCICFRHRFPSISPQFMNVIQITSGILSLSCFIICLITSIYSGKKGNLIASYDNTCKTITLEQYKQTKQFYNNISFNNKIINNSYHQSINQLINNSNFNKQSIKSLCCYEIIKNTCECYINHYNQYIEYYHNISCHLLLSSIKDYIILQSALMCIGSGVSLWLWFIFIENKLKLLLINNQYTRISFSSITNNQLINT
uniref:Non-specific serine/threonine protein kinase n=1 Tax=Schistosoma mansoni TaxID=6183 RepID=A0A5K4FFK3_SCHMA